MSRIWVVIGSTYGFGAVAMSAVAAHGLGGLAPEAVQAVRDAVSIQAWHAPALLFVGVWAARGGVLAQLAGLAFAVGTLMFCGAVYALELKGVRLASVAPAGGMTLMAGWVLLALSCLRRG